MDDRSSNQKSKSLELALAGIEKEFGKGAIMRLKDGELPHGEVLAALGCATNPDRWVVIDPTGRTSVPGVWAAGNVVNPRAQVITAAGEGSAAAIALNADLVDEDVAAAVHALRDSR